MTSPTVKSRAHRALRQLPRFTSQEADLVRYANVLRLGEEEEIVGAYQNPENLPKCDVVISSMGLYLIGDEVTESLPFSEILSATGPTEKTQADRLVLELRGGRSIGLPILGGDERFRDVFAVLRFLDRVIADGKSRQAEATGR
jgi:hypothetical protein